MGNVKAKEKVRRHPPLSDAVRRFYEATETEIIIHAVRHQARKPFRDARRSLRAHNSRQNIFFCRTFNTGISLTPVRYTPHRRRPVRRAVAVT